MDDLVSIYNPVGVGAINAAQAGFKMLQESDSPAGYLARGDIKGFKNYLTTPRYSMPTNEDMLNLGLDTMTPMGVVGSIKNTGKKVLEKYGKEDLISVYNPQEFLTNTATKPNEMVGKRFTARQVEQLNPVELIKDPNDLYGSTIVPKASDITSRGRVIDEVSGHEMKNKMMTEGGIYYGIAPTNAADDIFYASNTSAATTDAARLQNAYEKNIELGGTGKILYGPSKMARYSEDFSTMPTTYALNFIDNGRFSKQLINELDDEIRQTLPQWKGIMTEEGRKQLFNPSDMKGDKVGSVYRKRLTNRLRNQKYQKELGFNWDDLENALLETDVIGAPSNSLGQILYEVDVPKLEIKPSSSSSYNKDLVAPNTAKSLGFNIPITELYGKKYMQDLLTGQIPYNKNPKNLLASDTKNPLQDAYGVLYMGKSGLLGKFMDEKAVEDLYNYQQFVNNGGLLAK
jgi:hypothetical protein